jgi:predicted ATPase
VPAAGLLVTLDDVQWADEATVALLRYVGADLPAARLVIAVATREAGAPGQLGGLPAARTLRLPPLTATEVAEYVRATAAGPVDPSWAAGVHRGSGGNPLFVRELVRAAAASDRLSEALRPLAGARLAGVGPDCRRLLGACAVIGEEFDVTLVAAATGGRPGSRASRRGGCGGHPRRRRRRAEPDAVQPRARPAGGVRRAAARRPDPLAPPRR